MAGGQRAIADKPILQIIQKAGPVSGPAFLISTSIVPKKVKTICKNVSFGV
jgi:hypothetical protein